MTKEVIDEAIEYYIKLIANRVSKKNKFPASVILKEIHQSRIDYNLIVFQL